MGKQEISIQFQQKILKGKDNSETWEYTKWYKNGDFTVQKQFMKMWARLTRAITGSNYGYLWSQC